MSDLDSALRRRLVRAWHDYVVALDPHVGISLPLRPERLTVTARR